MYNLLVNSHFLPEIKNALCPKGVFFFLSEYDNNWKKLKSWKISLLNIPDL